MLLLLPIYLLTPSHITRRFLYNSTTHHLELNSLLETQQEELVINRLMSRVRVINHASISEPTQQRTRAMILQVVWGTVRAS